MTFILPRHFPAALIIFAEDWTFFPVWFDDYFEQVCTFVVLIALVLKVLRKGAKRTTAAVTEAFTVKENLKIVSLSVEINCKMVIKCKKHACWTSIWLTISYCFCDALCDLWKLLNICNLRVVVQSKHSVVVAEKRMWTMLLFFWKKSCFWILYSITLNNRCEKMHNWKYITHVKHRGSLPN